MATNSHGNVRVEGLEDLRRLGAAYKAGGKEFRKVIRTALQEAAKPLADDVVREGAQKLPALGGLRARIASSRGSVSTLLGGRNVSVAIRLSNRQKDSLRAMDRGQLRHPVYGHRSTWVTQNIPAGAFSDPFDRGAPDVRERVRAEVEQMLSAIAGRVNRI